MKKTIFALISMAAVLVFASPASAQVCDYGITTPAIAVTSSYQITSGGLMCPGQMPTLTIPAGAHAITLCLVAPDSTVEVQTKVRNLWGIMSTVGGSNEAHCYNISPAITGLRIVALKPTAGVVDVGLVY